MEVPFAVDVHWLTGKRLRPSSFCDLETFIIVEVEPLWPAYHPHRGIVFLLTLCAFVLCFIVFVRICTFYKDQQNRKHDKATRLNQIDAGE